MADVHSPAAKPPAPVTFDGLLADRKKFWGEFTGFTMGGIVAVLIAVLLTLYFIL